MLFNVLRNILNTHVLKNSNCLVEEFLAEYIFPSPLNNQIYSAFWDLIHNTILSNEMMGTLQIQFPQQAEK